MTANQDVRMAMALRKPEMVNALRQLGLAAGDTVLVHGSLKSLGQVEGGADMVIDALRETLTPEGTLLMPSFQSASEFFLVDRGCRFDVWSSRSECGLISETFRRRPGVIRSLSPTHCTAGCGRRAAELLAGHERCRLSVGRGSPYHRLVEAGGKILLLGVTHDANTTLHFVENTNGAPTICRQEYTPSVVNANGVEITVPMLPHMPGLPRNYTKVEPLLRQAGIQVNARVGPAEARLVQAEAMAAMIGEKVRDQPLFLIKPFVFPWIEQAGA